MIHSLFHQLLPSANLPTSIQSIPASLKILFQCNTVYLFFPGAFFTPSNFLYHPSTATFVRLSSFNRITCPTLSSTLFSIFHCTLFTPSLELTSYMFSPRACIWLKGSPFLLLHIYRQHLSIHFCNLITTFFHHTLAWQSNSNALSTHACTILACHLLRPRYTRGFLTRASRLFGNDPASKHPSPVTLLFSLGLSPSD